MFKYSFEKSLRIVLIWILSIVSGLGIVFRLTFIYVTNLISQPLKVKDRILMEPPTCLSSYNHKYVIINKVRLHYVESGDKTKPLMLFIHGFPDFWYTWRHQIPEFSKDYWVVALDLRGQNQSDKPTGKENYKMEILTSDLKKFIEYTGSKKCILICHDWGAFIGWRFVKQYGHMVHKYVMLNNPPLEMYYDLTFGTMDQFRKSLSSFVYNIPYLAEKFLETLDFDIFFEMWNRKFTVNFTEDDLETYKYVFSKRGTLTAGLNYYRSNTSEIGYSSGQKIDGSNGMFIFGQRDKYISQAACITVANEFSKLRVEVIPNSNHFTHQDAPKLTNMVIRDFLNQ